MMLNPVSENELALRCARRESQAQGELYTRYAGRLYAVCFRYTGDREEAQDLMHDSMIKAMDNIGLFRYSGDGSLYAWLRRLAVNVSIDRLREKGKSLVVSLDSAIEQDTPEPQEEDVENIPVQVMLDMVASLPPVRRTVFNMYCIDGFSHKEIAQAINITEKGSASILAKSRAQLKEAIKDYLKRTGK
ncbi:MAG: sigma-70 family RNA polymerase sigma factor [Bacteroidaceae bacterium]|nr:sigma-70 family RNA polymerase sigma factor [Bacteroidaceae bacterium]